MHQLLYIFTSRENNYILNISFQIVLIPLNFIFIFYKRKFKIIILKQSYINYQLIIFDLKTVLGIIFINYSF